MDANVRVLMDATGCTETEAQNVLAEAKNDISKALQLLDSSAKEALVLLVQLDAAGKKGYMVIMLDMKREALLHADVVYPLPAELISMLDINMPPTVFVSTMGTVKDRLPERQRGAAASNASHLKTELAADAIRSLIQGHRSSRMDQINEQLGAIASKILGDTIKVRYYGRAYSMDSVAPVLHGLGVGTVDSPEARAARTFKKSEEQSTGPKPIDTGELASASPQDPLPRIVLICEPEISPFHGTPCRDLKPGDEVVVKIKDGRESARYFAELLGGAVGDELVPLLAPIVKLDRISDSFMEIFIEFGPGVYGEFFIPPDVKIKTKTEDLEIYDPFRDEESVFSDERFGRQIMTGLIVLIAATAALIVLFWGLS